MREEQPMPETIATSSGRRPRPASARLSEATTPKSPQPGHQTGLVSDRKSFAEGNVVAGAFMGGSMRRVRGGCRQDAWAEARDDAWRVARRRMCTRRADSGETDRYASARRPGCAGRPRAPRPEERVAMAPGA